MSNVKIKPMMFSFPIKIKEIDDELFEVTFYDFEGTTFGKSYHNAIMMACEFLDLTISGMMLLGKKIPAPSYIENATWVSVQVMGKEPEDFKYIERTVKCPNYLLDEAKIHNIDISNLLETALKIELGYR